jgi:phage head maturation protease
MKTEKDLIKEELSKNIVRISCEDLNIVKGPNGLKVVGLALPFDAVSRNNFTYITESIEKAKETMVNKSCLFNHNPEAVIGHVKEAGIESAGMGYQVDINPNATNPATGVRFAESIERGDLKKVSIQCMYDSDKSFMDESGVTHAYIKEFLELSFVTIPGFEDTTAQVVESFKTTRGKKMSEENPKQEEPSKDESEKKPEEEKKEEPKEEEKKEEAKEKYEEPKKEEDEKENPIKEVMKKIETMDKRISAIEKYVKEQMDDDEDSKEEDDDEKKEEDDDEEKREEAIKADKKTVTKEATQGKPKEVTTSDVKQLFMK